jgi:hypothetical protein
MNNYLPEEEDPQLTNFLRQYRSIAPAAPLELEDTLMKTIESRSEVKERRIFRLWLKYVSGLVGAIGTGILGASIHYMMNPPEPKIASDLDRLDRYVEVHWRSVVPRPIVIDDRDDLDAYLLQEDDVEEI